MHLPPCWPARILRLDVGRRDELAPLLGLVGDQVSKLGGRERKRGATPNRLDGRQGWNARSDQLYQTAESLTHLRERRRLSAAPISHWTTVRFCNGCVPLEFTQDESGSASFGNNSK